MLSNYLTLVNSKQTKKAFNYVKKENSEPQAALKRTEQTVFQSVLEENRGVT